MQNNFNENIKRLTEEKNNLNDIDKLSYKLFTQEQIDELLTAIQKGKSDTAQYVYASIIEPKLYNKDSFHKYRKFREKILSMELDFLSEAYS